jgi:isoquinoline 1-oxidoreductase subunit beta
LVGGGFGRRLEVDGIVEALRVARSVRRPVQLLWSREEDVRHDVYRPPSIARVRAATDGGGHVSAWEHHVASPSVLDRYAARLLAAGGDRELLQSTIGDIAASGIDPYAVEGIADQSYAIPNFRCEYHNVDVGVPFGFWRSTGRAHSAFATECLLDELAVASGSDPIELRMRMLSQAPRARAVLDAVRRASGWERAPSPPTARGVALHEAYGSVIATVATVAVHADGHWRVVRLDCAVDCGLAIDPDGVRAQIEGGATFGLSATLMGAITITDGIVDQSNFHDCPVIRMAEAPPVSVTLVASDAPPGGVGELGVPTVAPAVANALFRASGVRHRTLPLPAAAC